LRHRLSSCVLNYQQLKQLAKIELNKILSSVDQPDTSPQTPIDALYSLPASSSHSMQSLHNSGNELDKKSEPDAPSILLEDEEDTSIWDASLNLPLANILGKPSALLSSRCPICFGREKPVLQNSRCVSSFFRCLSDHGSERMPLFVWTRASPKSGASQKVRMRHSSRIHPISCLTRKSWRWKRKWKGFERVLPATRNPYPLPILFWTTVSARLPRRNHQRPRRRRHSLTTRDLWPSSAVTTVCSSWQT
jgi:hypothetical protein